MPEKKIFDISIKATIETSAKFTAAELKSMLICALLKDDDTVILDEAGSDEFFVVEYHETEAIETTLDEAFQEAFQDKSHQERIERINKIGGDAE